MQVCLRASFHKKYKNRDRPTCFALMSLRISMILSVVLAIASASLSAALTAFSNFRASAPFPSRKGVPFKQAVHTALIVVEVARVTSARVYREVPVKNQTPYYVEVTRNAVCRTRERYRCIGREGAHVLQQEYINV